MYLLNPFSGGFASVCCGCLYAWLSFKIEAFSTAMKISSESSQSITWWNVVYSSYLFLQIYRRRPVFARSCGILILVWMNIYEKLLSCKLKFCARLVTRFWGVRCYCFGIIPFKQVSIALRACLQYFTTDSFEKLFPLIYLLVHKWLDFG